MKLTVATMAIGSLVWDEHPVRKRWREERLELASRFIVRAPIRYGRRSQSRGDSYTMVVSEELSRDDSRLGTALAAVCRRKVERLSDLVDEAEQLWAAECKTVQRTPAISSAWGGVALALNPAREIAAEIKEAWAARVSGRAIYGRFQHAYGEGSAVTTSGLLAIPWPNLVDGSPLNVDLILCTSTQPTLVDGRYPSARQIADSWLTADGRPHVEYFWNNIENDVRTFQDDEIKGYVANTQAEFGST